MTLRRKGNSDRESSVPEQQRVDAVLTDAAAAQIGQPQDKSPVQLYEKCAVVERDSTKVDLDPIKMLIAKALFFGEPLFGPAPVMNPVKDKAVDLKIRTKLWEAQKYRSILEYLRSCANLENRLFLIAWWLKLENVCEPEEILGFDKFRKMARRKLFFLSDSEFRNAHRVLAWLPYFERLLRDLSGRSITHLVSLGYEESCVAATRGNEVRLKLPATG